MHAYITPNIVWIYETILISEPLALEAFQLSGIGLVFEKLYKK